MPDSRQRSRPFGEDRWFVQIVLALVLIGSSYLAQTLLFRLTWATALAVTAQNSISNNEQSALMKYSPFQEKMGTIETHRKFSRLVKKYDFEICFTSTS